MRAGKGSTKIPPFHLVHRAALTALAQRHARGVRTKGINGAWNACSADQEKALEDQEFIVERLAHGIDHCYKAIARLTGNMEPLDAEEEGDGGDAGAIMFAGALLAASEEHKRNKGTK